HPFPPSVGAVYVARLKERLPVRERGPLPAFLPKARAALLPHRITALCRNLVRHRAELHYFTGWAHP
ncbi:MAG TPA: hypothetical protein PK597_08180, partial [Oscillospiraceae bacterium]|nr:hypothetical protein [Oscillospiraceae bacterium]